MNSEDSEDILAELEEIGERLKHAAPQQDNNNVQIVKHEGLGAWGPAAIVACFASMLLAVGFAVMLSRDNDKLARRVETLEAWNGVNNNTIAELKSRITSLEKR